MPARLTTGHARSPRRAKTRERLIDAALEIVARDGFHAASVHAIADRAGYSVGAVYSNFDGKDDLFFAVFEERVRWLTFESDVEAIASAADPAALITDWMRLIARDPSRFLVFVEFWAYAVRKPQVRRKLAARLREMRDALAEAIAERARKGNPPTALSPDTIALAALSLGRGLTLEMLVDPDSVSDETIRRVVAELVPRS